jgi:hypothetical protein
MDVNAIERNICGTSGGNEEGKSNCSESAMMTGPSGKDRCTGCLENCGKGKEKVGICKSIRRKRRMESMVVTSLSISLLEVQNRCGEDTVAEIIKLISNDLFNVQLFKNMVKTTEDCKKLTNDVLDKQLMGEDKEYSCDKE